MYVCSILSGSIETLEFLCKELHINPNRGPKDWEPGMTHTNVYIHLLCILCVYVS